jgi:hypothetical protein
VFFLPWWVLMPCLTASAFATYLLLVHTRVGDSPWALFPLTAVLAPMVLVGAWIVALVLSTSLSALLGDRPQPPSESKGAETTLERTVPPTTSTPPSAASPSASPAASPAASPTASSTTSPAASSTASPSP